MTAIALQRFVQEGISGNTLQYLFNAPTPTLTHTNTSTHTHTHRCLVSWAKCLKIVFLCEIYFEPTCLDVNKLCVPNLALRERDYWHSLAVRCCDCSWRQVNPPPPPHPSSSPLSSAAQKRPCHELILNPREDLGRNLTWLLSHLKRYNLFWSLRENLSPFFRCKCSQAASQPRKMVRVLGFNIFLYHRSP